MIKLPKELELPQMKDYQMFKRERIVALQEKLQDKFKSLKVRGKKTEKRNAPCVLRMAP